MKILSIDVGIKNLAFCILENLNDKYIIIIVFKFNTVLLMVR